MRPRLAGGLRRSRAAPHRHHRRGRRRYRGGAAGPEHGQGHRRRSADRRLRGPLPAGARPRRPGRVPLPALPARGRRPHLRQPRGRAGGPGAAGARRRRPRPRKSAAARGGGPPAGALRGRDRSGHEGGDPGRPRVHVLRLARRLGNAGGPRPAGRGPEGELRRRAAGPDRRRAAGGSAYRGPGVAGGAGRGPGRGGGEALPGRRRGRRRGTAAIGPGSGAGEPQHPPEAGHGCSTPTATRSEAGSTWSASAWWRACPN